MFRHAIVIAALAVSASLAVSIAATSPAVHQREQEQPRQLQEEPIMAGTSIVTQHKKHAKPEKLVFVQAEVKENEGPGLLESGLFGLLEAVSVPKKLLGVAAGLAVSALKSVNVRKVLKTALIGALITVLGAVAAVSVAGLVSLVTGICAVLPYIKYVLGGGKAAGGHHAEPSHLDNVSDFVMGAFHKYDGKRNA